MRLAFPKADRDCVAMQAAEYQVWLSFGLSAQRSCRALTVTPVCTVFSFRDGFGPPHGPRTSDDQLWQEMAKALTLKGPSAVVCGDECPPATPSLGTLIWTSAQ
jgi:hypothetical protein